MKKRKEEERAGEKILKQKYDKKEEKKKEKLNKNKTTSHHVNTNHGYAKSSRFWSCRRRSMQTEFYVHGQINYCTYIGLYIYMLLIHVHGIY